MESRYGLAPGVQVREEDFGLLFYSMNGPKLYFLPSKQMLSPQFFQGEMTLGEWMERTSRTVPEVRHLSGKLKRAIDNLKHKGVVVEY